MQLDDFYQGGAWLRRWHIDGRGQPACWPPVDVAATAQADIEAIVAANEGVREGIDAVRAFEEARRVADQPAPTKHETYVDENGVEQIRVTEAYQAWEAARGIVDGADPDAVALADLRADPPADVEPMADDFEPAPFEPADESVTAERDRRIDAGVVFDGKRYQSGPKDRENIAGAATLALIAITIGGKATDDIYWSDKTDDEGNPLPFEWIADDNSTVVMDPLAVIAFGRRAAAWKEDHTFKARAIKNMDPVPADFTDDSYWPS